MNSASAQPLSGIPPVALAAPEAAQDICARIDALLAPLLLWASRLGLFGRWIAPQLDAIARSLRALSALFARLAAGDLPAPAPASPQTIAPPAPPARHSPAPNPSRAHQASRPVRTALRAPAIAASPPRTRIPARHWLESPARVMRQSRPPAAKTQKTPSRGDRARSPFSLRYHNNFLTPSRNPSPCLHCTP